MKIGYLGPEGTFSEEASQLYKKSVGSNVGLIPYATFYDLLFAVEQGKIAEAIAPIENSIEGTIGTITDMLAKDVNLFICQEMVLPVYHYLIAPKGIKLSAITDVISIPQALDQCKDFLRKHLPKAKVHMAASTSNAVMQVATSIGEKLAVHRKIKGGIFAAIGTKSAAHLYALNILAKKINAKDNQTRFVVLAKKDHPRTGKDKTSIVFSIRKDRPGGLHACLAAFAAREINLTKIESRPSKKALGDYYFFIDMEGHRQDRIITGALAELKKQTGFFKLLGSYPKFRKNPHPLA
ncbi:MAG: prephenate dehydratase [Candidatus Margulisbacteria bacterium]|nr:prephenate dehydratase [Candidatus Margulisiibacteriota bacterium]